METQEFFSLKMSLLPKVLLGNSASSRQLWQALLKQEWFVGCVHSLLFHFVERRDWRGMGARAVHEVVRSKGDIFSFKLHWQNAFPVRRCGGCLCVNEDPKYLTERNWQLNFAIFIVSLISKLIFIEQWLIEARNCDAPAARHCSESRQ